jgi:predicted Zn-dependent peptidase
MLSDIKDKGFIFLLLILFSAFSAFTSCSKTERITSGNYTYEIVKNDPLNARIYKLENGLTVYMTIYKDAPRIQTAIAVKAGSKNDPRDATGMAHYLEHLMFKGSDEFGVLDYEKEKIEIDKIVDLFEIYRQETDSLKRIAIYHKIDSISGVAAKYAIANEYDKMLNSIGAKKTNAFTSLEQTIYITDIPTNQFEKWLTIEAERFQDPVMRLFHTELEVVYEEKNRSLDWDYNKVMEALNAGLFQKHPYGTQTTLGSIEHIKNPSMKKVIEYYNTYYVPNNMAICLSGDFNPDKAIQLIDKKFGKLAAKHVPAFSPPVEDPITEPIIKNVWGPDAEIVRMAFRFPGVSSKDADLLTMVDMILMNGAAGLIDLNLNQKQKIIEGYSYPRIMKDYSMHVLSGRPKEGQDMEEVTKLLLSQIELVKKGEFPDWILPAIINDLKLYKINGYEKNWPRVYDFIKAFTMDISWENYVGYFDRLSKITKEDIVDFANKYYHDNYVVVYKHTGEDKNVKKIIKPQITKMDINRTDRSDFFKNISAMKVEDIQPVFIDYTNDIDQFTIKNDIPVYYKENTENDLFRLYYVLDMGTDNNTKIKAALDYLRYLGTSEYSPEELKQEFYKIGCSFSVSNSRDQVYVSLSGLIENFEAGLELFESLLVDAQPNPAALDNLVKDIIKIRADNKLSKHSILWDAMYNYGVYGAKSPYTNLLTEGELNDLIPEELIDIINKINSYEHRILYYGPIDKKDLKLSLNQHHNVPEKLNPIPEPQEFTQLPAKTNNVYVVDYDMKQVEIIMLSKSESFNKDNAATRTLFNEYYGKNMSSVVFQELREAKALAYSVYAAYKTPAKKEDAHYVFSYIGAQADKLPEAMDGMLNLLTNMPESDVLFSLSKEAVIKKIQTERITKADVLFNYEKAKKLGLDYDIRKDIYDNAPNLKIENIKAFFNKYIKDKKYTILILGDVKKVNNKALSKYGKVKYLTLEDVFGY